MTFFILVVLTILICSIPFGFICLAIGLDKDPRLEGSKNIGMTNVWRLGGASLGLLTLAGDLGKSFLCLWFAKKLDCQLSCLEILALIALVSNCFSIYLNFSGGKGVATAGGALIVLSPTIFGSLVGIWLLSILLTRNSGLASLIAAIVIIPLAGVIQPELFWTCLTMAVIVVIRHQKNIQLFLEPQEKYNSLNENQKLPDRFFDK